MLDAFLCTSISRNISVILWHESELKSLLSYCVFLFYFLSLSPTLVENRLKFIIITHTENASISASCIYFIRAGVFLSPALPFPSRLLKHDAFSEPYCIFAFSLSIHSLLHTDPPYCTPNTSPGFTRGLELAFPCAWRGLTPGACVFLSLTPFHSFPPVIAGMYRNFLI